jgi:hypothetical protein
MTYTQKDNRVTLAMDLDDYAELLQILGFALGMARQKDDTIFREFLEFTNRLNAGNPRFVAYGIRPLGIEGILKMPELNDESLVMLREKQKKIERCQDCSAQTFTNYCRLCDEFFTDGHWTSCVDFSEHSKHRKY